jgi:putative ABC transport system permease protein
MLGIILGVGSVIATLALGEGSARDVQTRIQGLGANHLSVRPGVQRDRCVRLNRALRMSLKYGDAEAIHLYTWTTSTGSKSPPSPRPVSPVHKRK